MKPTTRAAPTALALGLVAASGLAACSAGSPADRATVPAAAASGYPLDVASALCAAGLRPVFVSTPPIKHADRNINGYAVASTSPRPLDGIAPGSAVQIHLIVSANAGGPWPAAPATAVLPQVVGVDVNTAIATLTAEGLFVDVTTASPTGTLVVAAQAPAAGATVPRSSTVTLTVGQLDSDACTSP
jgi:hypothetical protein